MDVTTLQRIIEREIERQHGDHVERKAGLLLVTANVAINCEDIAKEIAAAVRAYVQVHLIPGGKGVTYDIWQRGS